MGPMFKGPKKAIVERTLGAELAHHLGYAKGEQAPSDQPNHRNGTSARHMPRNAPGARIEWQIDQCPFCS